MAGSDLDMATAVRNMIAAVKITPEAAVIMASTAPARFLGIDRTRGCIAPGFAADLVHVDRLSGDATAVLATWIDGVRA